MEMVQRGLCCCRHRELRSLASGCRVRSVQSVTAYLESAQVSIHVMSMCGGHANARKHRLSSEWLCARAAAAAASGLRVGLRRGRSSQCPTHRRPCSAVLRHRPRPLHPRHALLPLRIARRCDVAHECAADEHLRASVLRPAPALARAPTHARRGGQESRHDRVQHTCSEADAGSFCVHRNRSACIELPKHDPTHSGGAAPLLARSETGHNRKEEATRRHAM